MQVAISQAADVTSLAHRIIWLSQPYDIEGRQALASIGVSVGPGDGISPDQICNADLALIAPGGDGRSRFFERGMDAQMQAAARECACEALAGRVRAHQPVADLASNEISGLEALTAAPPRKAWFAQHVHAEESV
jgi:predicted signal transduction protein with EAL and GGDEF domain